MENIGKTVVEELKSKIPSVSNLNLPTNPADALKRFDSGNISGTFQSFANQGKTLISNAEGKAKELKDKLNSIKKPSIPSFKGVIKPPPFKPLKEFKVSKPPKTNLEKNREKLQQKGLGGFKNAMAQAQAAQSKIQKGIDSAKSAASNIQSQAQNAISSAQNAVSNAQNAVSNIQSQAQNAVSNIQSQASNITSNITK